MADYNICRKEVQAEGAPVQYCTERIAKANALNWCEKHRAKLPLWPKGDAVEDPALTKSGAAARKLEEAKL